MPNSIIGPLPLRLNSVEAKNESNIKDTEPRLRVFNGDISHIQITLIHMVFEHLQPQGHPSLMLKYIEVF